MINIDKMATEEKETLLDQTRNQEKYNQDTIKTFEILSKDNDSLVRNKVAEILVIYDLKETEDILINLLSDEDEVVRMNASDSLCVYSINAIEPLINRILTDKSSLVRAYSYLSIADITLRTKYNKDHIVGFFKDMLKKEKVNRVKIDIYSALYILGEKNYLSCIIEYINNKNYINRCAAINTLDDFISEKKLSKNDIYKIKEQLYKRLIIEKSKAVIDCIDNLLAKI